MTHPAGPVDDGAVVLRAPRQTLPEPQAGHVHGLGAVGPLAVFTLTTFLSALLLFSIQPMFAKMVLPVLGGSTSVWAVAMCFFQGALLAGYAYAHLMIRFVPARLTGYVHLALYALAAVALPIAIPVSWGEPPPGEPYLWQLGLFAVSVGLPFVAVAANAPLLQAWFARTGHAHAKDPYFLYAASNLGSLIALLSYPLVLEPLFGLRALSGIWTIGFGLLAAALAACFWIMRRSSGAAADAEADGGDARVSEADPTWMDRIGWVGLALVPSALLTAFTTHVTTDIASAPLLWVLPLSMYLLTFVIVFRERALLPTPVLLVLHLGAVILALLQLAQTKHETWFLSSLVGVVVFFTSALVAHRTLYDARPAARYLTEFYLWMSFGGVLGGLFAALVAPKLFSEVFEYPLLLALSMACRPGALGLKRHADGRLTRPDAKEIMRQWLLTAAGALLIFWLPWAASKLEWTFDDWGAVSILAAIFGAAMLVFWNHPPRQLLLALLTVVALTTLPSGVKRGDAQRSYFGIYRVSLSEDGAYNVLTHGTTLHGAQRVRDAAGNAVADATPGTYYHPASPMAMSIDIVRRALGREGESGRYGVVGLGAGSLACQSEQGEAWRFFEIDPVVVGIAAESGRFTYLANCQPDADIVIGDARLTIAKEVDHSFDLILVDAFSSDAVPVHLMTAEALKLYTQKIKAGGVLVLHISNRYLDLEAVLGATLRVVPELKGLIVSDDESDGSYASTNSTIAVFSRDPDVLDSFRALKGAHDLDAKTLRPWTDDYSDILGPFLSKMRARSSE
ncbi:MAG: hypothetical protein CTY20_04020 [Hyphomicrobium sp.]|nr:MAG: hypothetical protein CTY20_04020 [Hyphomicrobium sp.]